MDAISTNLGLANFNFARFIYEYRYQIIPKPGNLRWDLIGNIGDAIQSIAVQNLYDEMKITNVSFVNRDDLPVYDDGREGQVILPFQAYLDNLMGVSMFPWSRKIHPVFIGMHLAWGIRERASKPDVVSDFKQYQPIGCRDKNTMRFLQNLGVDAYFSACMTLTFPKRKGHPENGKIFCVDLTPKSLRAIPKFIKDKADFSVTHSHYYPTFPIPSDSALELEEKAKLLLKRYEAEAALVITSKIHCAMPCAAMGIPVIFIHENKDDARFDVLDGILPRYIPDDARHVDWSPPAPEFEDYKQTIKENAFYQICKPTLKAKGVFSSEEEARRIAEIQKKRPPAISVYHPFFWRVGDKLQRVTRRISASFDYRIAKRLGKVQ